MSPVRHERMWLAAIIVLHLVLAASFARVIYPIDDEAYYASPAANLLMHGHFGTTTYENQALPNLAQRSFWIMPVYPAMLTGWFRVFGVGLWEQRLLSAAFGGLAVWAWYWIILGLSKDTRLALLTAALLAIDHSVLSGANGRPDLMGGAWGMLAMAAYVFFRENRFLVACFLGYFGTALAGLTHPLPGVLAFCNITLLLLLLDRGRLDRKALAVSLMPFALGSLALVLFVHPHWVDAYEQFRWGATFPPGGKNWRLSGWSSPLATWWRVAGYVIMQFGPAEGGNPLAWIKLAIPLTYIVSAALAVALPRVRRAPGVPVLLTLAVANCLLLPMVAAYEKWQYYMHLLVFFPPLVVLVLAALWRGRSGSRALPCAVALLVGVMVSLQSVRIIHSLRLNSLGTRYELSAARLRQPPFDKGTFWGKSYWAYAVGLDRLTEDFGFGYYSHARKDFLILDADQFPFYSGNNMSPVAVHLRGLLNREYTLAYEDQTIRVYARRPH